MGWKPGRGSWMKSPFAVQALRGLISCGNASFEFFPVTFGWDITPGE